MYGFKDSAKVKSQLGISTKSIMHNWKQAGNSSGGIPGYAENYARIAKYAKWMRGVGYVGIALDGLNSASKVTEACTEGREAECEKTSFAETGRFTGSTIGGAAGSTGAYLACNAAFGFESVGTSLLWCGLVAGGVGGATGGAALGSGGKWLGTEIYELKNYLTED